MFGQKKAMQITRLKQLAQRMRDGDPDPQIFVRLTQIWSLQIDDIANMLEKNL